jgi:hypothetical protein
VVDILGRTVRARWLGSPPYLPYTVGNGQRRSLEDDVFLNASFSLPPVDVLESMSKPEFQRSGRVAIGQAWASNDLQPSVSAGLRIYKTVASKLGDPELPWMRPSGTSWTKRPLRSCESRSPTSPQPSSSQVAVDIAAIVHASATKQLTPADAAKAAAVPVVESGSIWIFTTLARRTIPDAEAAALVGRLSARPRRNFSCRGSGRRCSPATRPRG